MEINLFEFAKSVADYNRSLTRGAYGIKEALQQAKQADADSVDRIIVDESESAYTQFYAAKKGAESGHGFAGQARLKSFFANFQNASVEQRRTFAKYLMSLDKNVVRAMDNASARGTKRSFHAIECDAPASLNPDTMLNGTSTSNSEDRQNGVYVNASLQEAKTLFKEDFMDSIQRIPSTHQPGTLTADISTILQKGSIRDQFGCQMIIGIVEQKVATYAKELFGVDVEVKDGVRYIHYPGGSKIEPDPTVKLRGCRREKIAGMLGDKIHIAFSKAPVYLREEKELRNLTDGLSMTIPNRADEGGFFTLFMGEFDAFHIKDQLYKQD